MDANLHQRAALASGTPELSHDAQQALERLLRVHGPGGLKAALLAMLLAPGHERRLEACSTRPCRCARPTASAPI